MCQLIGFLVLAIYVVAIVAFRLIWILIKLIRTGLLYINNRFPILSANDVEVSDKCYSDFSPGICIMLNNVFSMMFKIAETGGFITQRDFCLINKTFQSFSLSHKKESEKGFYTAKNTYHENSFEFYAQGIKSIAVDKEILVNLVDLLFDLAFIDEELSFKKEQLINIAINIFNVTGTAYHNYKLEINRNHNTQEEYYNKIFGIEKEVPFRIIKEKYKTLIKQYHPDKYHHLDQQYRKKAEEKMTQINIAYEYLKNKYQSNFNCNSCSEMG